MSFRDLYERLDPEPTWPTRRAAERLCDSLSPLRTWPRLNADYARLFATLQQIADRARGAR
jgi:hypothetical protein